MLSLTLLTLRSARISSLLTVRKHPSRSPIPLLWLVTTPRLLPMATVVMVMVDTALESVRLMLSQRLMLRLMLSLESRPTLLVLSATTRRIDSARRFPSKTLARFPARLQDHH